MFVIGIACALLVAFLASRQNDAELMVLALGWTWVVCMQLFEYFVWIKKDPDNTVSKMAYAFNMMQLPVLCLLFLSLGRCTVTERWVASSFVIVYMTVIMVTTHAAPIRTRDHLVYPWWKQSWIAPIFYFTTLAIVLICVLHPKIYALSCVVVLFVLYAISAVFYYSYSPSLWCFFAAGFPIVALGLRSLIKAQN